MAFPRNSTDDDDTVAGDQLRSIVERFEKLDEEERDIKEDKADILKEAKANGYDVKVLKKVIAIRRRDPNERREEEAILDLYLQAVGETPRTAEERAPKHRVGAGPSRVEKAAASVAGETRVTITAGGVTGEMSLDTLTTLADAAKTPAGRAAVDVALKAVKGKSLVGSFTPPADAPPEDAFGA